MFTQLKTIIRNAVRGLAARRAYFAADRDAGRLWVPFEREARPAGRAAILNAMANLELTMSNVHRDAFGPDPIEHEGGRDLADSLALASRLVRIVANTESLLAAECGRYGRASVVDELALADDRTVWPVLDELCRSTVPAERAELTRRFYDLVVTCVGGQAAESLASIAASYDQLGRNLHVDGFGKVG